jgi:hypothetical protein
LDAKGENKTAWHGLLCAVDRLSDTPPGGSQSHRIIVPRALAERTVTQLRHLPVNASSGLGSHDKPRIVGVIQAASVTADGVHVRGVLFEKNQRDAVATSRAHARVLGLSFEVSDVGVANEHERIWRLDDLTWTGCSILERAQAAYTSSWIRVE